MIVKKVKEIKSTENPHGIDARKIYDTENAEVVHLTLLPGQALKRHVTPVDVFFYVIKGKGIVEIGKEKEKVVEDTLIESPAKIPHCWYNETDEVLKILVVKVPKPRESTRIL